MDFAFNEADWQRIESDYTAWWEDELERPLLETSLVHRNVEWPHGRFMTNWPEDMTDDELVDIVTRLVGSQLYLGDAFPSYFVNFGAGTAAAFTGATPRTTHETVWFEPADQHDLKDIAIRLDPENPWWQRIQHVTKVLAERLGDRVAISFLDIGGNLDILASLRGTGELLMDMATEPQKVGRLCREITQMWMEVYDTLHALIAPHCRGTVDWAQIWAPGRTYFLQSDLSYMISPDMFKDFVVPDLQTCAEIIDYPFYHLDGAGQIAHLEHLCAMDTIRGIQWIPGAGNPPPAEWPEVIDKIREAGKLCQLRVSPQEAMDVIKRHGAKGFHFRVNSGDLTPASAEAFIRDVRDTAR